MAKKDPKIEILETGSIPADELPDDATVLRTEETTMQNIDLIKAAIIDKAGQMALALAKGKDLEIRKSAAGITVAEVTKKVQR